MSFRIEEEKLVERSIGLLQRYCKRHDYLFDHPSSTGSEVIEANGLTYVILRNCHGVLAVYSKYPEQKRMRHIEPADWPVDIMAQ